VQVPLVQVSLVNGGAVNCPWLLNEPEQVSTASELTRKLEEGDTVISRQVIDAQVPLLQVSVSSVPLTRYRSCVAQSWLMTRITTDGAAASTTKSRKLLAPVMAPPTVQVPDGQMNRTAVGALNRPVLLYEPLQVSCDNELNNRDAEGAI
jgi:hypothetical protein